MYGFGFKGWLIYTRWFFFPEQYECYLAHIIYSFCMASLTCLKLMQKKVSNDQITTGMIHKIYCVITTIIIMNFFFVLLPLLYAFPFLPLLPSASSFSFLLSSFIFTLFLLFFLFIFSPSSYLSISSFSFLLSLSPLPTPLHLLLHPWPHRPLPYLHPVLPLIPTTPNL